ncbi:hypothetical protein Q5752_002686 [Cryptotrichosporon argae]
MTASRTRQYRIAVCGGGIAGATSAIALLRLGHDVQVFDGARELREIGASIALQPCALRCLDKLGLGADVGALAYRHGPHPLVHRHWRTAAVIATPVPDPLPEERHQMARFYRVALHRMLVGHIPPERVHLGKRVVHVDAEHTHADGDAGARVVFADGTAWEGDGVVGADGIHSAVRQVFYPDYAIDPGQLITLRQVFPASILGALAAELPQESCHWPGPDRQLFTSPLSGGLFSSGADGTAPTAELAGFFANWHPSVHRLAVAVPRINVYPDYHGPALPQLNHGRAVLIGDAGHPHGGAFAAGGTMGVEDGYTLGLCVAAAAERGLELDWAWDVFNACRLDHVNRLVAAATQLREQRREREGRLLGDDEIERIVHARNDVKWLADNDAEAVFRRTLAEMVKSTSIIEDVAVV